MKKSSIIHFLSGASLFGGMCAFALVLTQCTQDLELPPPGTVSDQDPRALQLDAEAKKFEAEKKPGKAIKRYESIVHERPLSKQAPAAQYRAAQLYEMTGKPQEAFDAYQNLISMYPDTPLYKQALQGQKDLAFRAARGEIVNKVFGSWKVNMSADKVMEWLNKLVENAPYANTAPESLNLLGDFQAKRGYNREAIASFDKILENYPTSPLAPMAQLKVANLYYGNHEKGTNVHVNIERAQEAYEDFLQKYPGHAKAKDARKGLANVRASLVDEKLAVGEYYLTRMKDTSAAVFCFQDVVNNAKDNPAAAAKAKAHLKSLGISVK